MKESLPPITRNRFLQSNLMKFITLFVGASLVFFVTVQSSWAKEYVVTMYFGGTSLPVNAWQPEINDYDNPSLMAVLHKNDQAPKSARHFKIFIAGVGAPETSAGSPPDHCGPGYAFAQKTFPHRELCRSWRLTVVEALQRFKDKVDDIFTNYEDGDTITLNVIGHSRGAIAAMWTLSEGMDIIGSFPDMVKLYHNDILTKINLIVVDPVPGIGMLADDDPANGVEDYGDVDTIGWDKFRLGSWLTQFVAIYAADERSNRFSGLLPLINDATETLIVSVRGAHQTVVGNTWLGGHAPVLYLVGCPGDVTCGRNTPFEALKIINDVVELTVHELIRSPEWGGVTIWGKNRLLENPFDPERSYQYREEAFLGKVYWMNNYEFFTTSAYPMMWESSYFGIIPLVGPPLESWNGNSCNRISVIGNIYTRCMERVKRSGHEKAGLSNMSEISSLGVKLGSQQAWNRIRVMGFGDEDLDGLADPDDNCPSKSNAAQEDSNNDGIGNACEPFMFGNGFEGAP